MQTASWGLPMMFQLDETFMDHSHSMSLEPNFVNETIVRNNPSRELCFAAGQTKSVEPPDPSEDGTSPSVFEKAREFIETGWLFRKVAYMYAERKTLACFFIHVAITVVIFTHSFIVKYKQRQETLQEGENKYWLKMMAPTLEFALAHTVLLHMTLLPLTMSRLSIVLGAETFLANMLPFNRMVQLHIYLGYAMILTVCAATTISLLYIGLVCYDGEALFCSKFSSEIMVTGYVMLILLLIVLVSSHFRHCIPHDIFYRLHHLVLVMYAVTIVHTFDSVQRNHERERSQTFKWFSATLLYYLCDRTAMAMNHSYQTLLVSSSVVTSTRDANDKGGSNMVMIKLQRPPQFRFHPGQYAFLRIRDIDKEYHPFSIASAPDSDYIEFYIEVFEPGSWTWQLWQLVSDATNVQTQEVGPCIMVDLMGPYGTSLGTTQEYSHAVGIGSGTGIVPMVSLLQQHVQQLLRLDADQYFRTLQRRQEKIYQLYQVSHKRSQSVSDKIVEGISKCAYKKLDATDTVPLQKRSISASLKAVSKLELEGDRQIALRDVHRDVHRAALPIFGIVTLLFVLAFGVFCLGVNFSFNAMNSPYWWMQSVLRRCTLVFHAMFAVMALFAQDIAEFKTFVDLLFLLLATLSDWYFYARDLWGNFAFSDGLLFGLINAYMVLSVWYSAAKSRRPHWRNHVTTDGIMMMDKVKFIWVTRSAALVSKLYPEISNLWMSLRNSWGEDATLEVCEISIYVTDRDKELCDTLREELRESDLYRLGAVKFERPDFSEIVERHTIGLILDPNTRTSNTLLAFCGNPNLSVMVHQAKISNDMSTVHTDNTLHSMEFVSESYGGVSKGGEKKKSKPTSTSPAPTGGASEAHGVSGNVVTNKEGGPNLEPGRRMQSRGTHHGSAESVAAAFPTNIPFAREHSTVSPPPIHAVVGSSIRDRALSHRTYKLFDANPNQHVKILLPTDSSRR